MGRRNCTWDGRAGLALVAGLLGLVAVLGLAGPVRAEGSEPGKPRPRTTYQDVVREFASVSCPGKTLEACTTSASEALREFIREKVEQGWTKERIVRTVVADYGERVLAVTPRRGFAWWLWILPVAGLMVGTALLALAVRRKAGRGGDGSEDSREVGSEGEMGVSAELEPYVAEVERAAAEDG